MSKVRYGGRGGSNWMPSGDGGVGRTDYFTIDGATQKRKQRRTKNKNKKVSNTTLRANQADRISPQTPKGPGLGRKLLGRGLQAGAVSAIGYVGSQLDKSGMNALRKSQRYLKANPMKFDPEFGDMNPKKGYMGRATWKANTRRALADMNKFGNRPSVPLSNAGSNAPVSVRPQRPVSSPVAKSKFEHPKTPNIGLVPRTVTTHSVDKVRANAAGSGGPQKGKSQVRIAFEKKFAAERKKQGAGGTFKFTNPVTGKTGTFTTDYEKPKKKKKR